VTILHRPRNKLIQYTYMIIWVTNNITSILNPIQLLVVLMHHGCRAVHTLRSMATAKATFTPTKNSDTFYGNIIQLAVLITAIVLSDSIHFHTAHHTILCPIPECAKELTNRSAEFT